MHAANLEVGDFDDAAPWEVVNGIVWQEIESTLQQYETDEGFVGPCELHVITATR